jgi:hypothetical protein
MSRVLLEIDHSLPQKELFKFLKDNKKALISQKKALPKFCDSVSLMPSYALKGVDDDGELEIKAIGGEAAIPDTAESLIVDVAANTSMWCDTAGDVLLKNSAKKSMKERKGLIPHIYDHRYEVLAEVGEVQNIYYQDVELRRLGLKIDGMAQVLTFKTEVIKSYNPAVFDKYRLKKIRQHSIGLRYEELLLAVNAPDDEYWTEEYKVWKKYIDDIINKEVPEARGYFWAVPQYMLLENSAVLIGANMLTPTLSTSEKESTNERPPGDGTEHGPEDENFFDIGEAIKEMKFFS